MHTEVREWSRGSLKYLYQPSALFIKEGNRCLMKRKTPSSVPAFTKMEAQEFPLPDILPEHTRLLLDVHTRTVLLFHQDSQDTPVLYSCQLAPSAARIFLALLQAYPQHCPHQTLFTALYSASQEALYDQEYHLRSIRRALMALAPVLQALGLAAVSLRGRGYVLAPAAHASSFPLTAS
jgi:hypothetical protein